LLDKIEADLQKILSNPEFKRITLNAHPFIASYLTKGISSVRFKWYLKYKKWITIIPRDAYQYLHFKFDTKK